MVDFIPELNFTRISILNLALKLNMKLFLLLPGNKLVTTNLFNSFLLSNKLAPSGFPFIISSMGTFAQHALGLVYSSPYYLLFKPIEVSDA